MSIQKIDLTDVQNVMQSNIVTPFELTDMTNSATLALASSRAEEIGNQIYRVEGGSETVTDSAADGIAYVYVSDPGSGVATAELLNTVPTYDPAKGGWYNGTAKAVFICLRGSGIFSNKYRLKAYNTYLEKVKTTDLVTTNLTTTNLTTTEMVLNSIANAITGSITALSLAGYLSGPFLTYNAGSFYFKIGKIVFCQFSTTSTTDGGGAFCFTNIPAAWRPAALTYIACYSTTTAGIGTEVRFYQVLTDGTVQAPTSGAGNTHTAVGSGFFLTS